MPPADAKSSVLFSRRLPVRGAAVALAVLSAACASAPTQVGDAGAPPPEEATPTSAKWLGNVWSNPQLPGFLDHWDQVTPENAGKWANMEPERDQYNWSGLDQAYALAKDNDLPFRFHVLVWGNQQPAWMETLPPAEQLEEIEERMAAIAERYPDIDYIEVVNEPLHDPPLKRNDNDRGSGNYVEALGGNGATGWDWVLNAFRMAKKHFPDTQLVLNEYSVTNSAASTGRYLEIVRLLQNEDLVDIIAVQAHSFSTTVHEDTTKANLDRLAATGLPIQVTEMDIDGEDDAVQLAEYKRIFPVFWDHPAVMGITMWGWRPGMWRTRFGAPLMHADGSPRPSMLWLMEYTGRKAPG
ncbi:MAG TPA: endo-1,4-beta-xylanase [Longimicrobiaceae bacterium]